MPLSVISCVVVEPSTALDVMWVHPARVPLMYATFDDYGIFEGYFLLTIINKGELLVYTLNTPKLAHNLTFH